MLMSSISLRFLSEKDAPLMLEWLHDLEITSCFRFDTGLMSLDKVYEFIRDSQDATVNVHFAVTDTETDEYLGTVSLKNIDFSAKSAEYAIVLRKKAQRHGCGYAATKQILEYAFYKLDIQRVYLNVLSDNEMAVRFYEKFGFIFEGEFLRHVFIRGEIHSLKWFRLMRQEYEKIMGGQE